MPTSACGSSSASRAATTPPLRPHRPLRQYEAGPRVRFLHSAPLAVSPPGTFWVSDFCGRGERGLDKLRPCRRSLAAPDFDAIPCPAVTLQKRVQARLRMLWIERAIFRQAQVKRGQHDPAQRRARYRVHQVRNGWNRSGRASQIDRPGRRRVLPAFGLCANLLNPQSRCGAIALRLLNRWPGLGQ